MKPIVYKICLIALIVSLEMAHLEVSFVVTLIVNLITFRKKISSSVAIVITLLSLMLAIGSLTVFNPENDYYHFLKDFIYFLRPILVLTAAYFIAMRFEKKTTFLNIIVLLGFGFALMHLLNMGINVFRMPSNSNAIRNTFGRYNHVENIALFIIICVKNLPIKKSKFRFIYKVFVGILVVSWLLYFSRTMILLIMFMSLAYYGYLKLNKKGTIALGFGGLVVMLFIGLLSVYDPPEQPEGVIDTFLSKVKNSYRESFSQTNFNPNDLDRRELWKNWRAFEAQRVFEEADKAQHYIKGQGFGSTVDIGFEVKLAGEYTQDLSLTHNGFAYIFMKTGALGWILFSFLFLYLYSFSYASGNGFEKIGNNIIVACSFYIIVTSFVVTGIYKPYDMSTLLLGVAFAYKQIEKIENRNFRNKRNT